jgi:predicted aldo/keto reductase-like oxidoreductase
MQYRTFGKLDWKPSALGFGAMRMPTLDDDSANIDEAAAADMLHYAIDHGVNYVDTAYPYHRENSERFLGRALQGGYRDKVKLATKMPTWLVEKYEHFDQYLDEQLQKLQTEQIDFYLLHALNHNNWPKLRDLGVLRWAEAAMASGRIVHFGFSFHDDLDTFKEIVDASDLWTMCQIQYNYVDTEYQAGTEGLKYAAGKGLAVVVMEPLRGGKLVNKIPPSVQVIWDGYPVSSKPVDASLQWVWNQPEVSLLLSGMSTMEHVVQNVSSAGVSGPGKLAAAELAVFDRLRAEYERISPIDCTDCRYCLPCPNGVRIPRIFEIYNDLMAFGSDDWANWAYNIQLPEEERGNMCIDCGECLEKCPQNIQIPDWLARAHEVLCKEEAA